MLDTDAEALPRLEPVVFDRLRSCLQAQGPVAAVEQLCTELRAAGQYDAFFYARLMQTRVQLGASPFPTGPAAELPSEWHVTYEEAIRQAARETGQLYLDKQDIGRAWVFFRMIEEPNPVREAIATYLPPEGDEQLSTVVQIAFQEGVHPERGFDLILEHFGICSAITYLSGVDPVQQAAVFRPCGCKLIRALTAQLEERLRQEIGQHAGSDPGAVPIPDLIRDRDWLFDEDAYHTDVSHLSSVVQMSMRLPRCDELRLARDLCVYGQHLGETFQGQGEPPFERMYHDCAVYLSLLLGEQTEAGLAHFQAKLEPAAAEGNTYPAEILVHLLDRLGEPTQALTVARQYLGEVEQRDLICPSLYELCIKAGDYLALAELAQERGEAVPFLAALVKQADAASPRQRPDSPVPNPGLS